MPTAPAPKFAPWQLAKLESIRAWMDREARRPLPPSPDDATKVKMKTETQTKG